MKFTKKIAALVLVLAMAVTMTSFALAEDAIRIGVIGPLTGEAAIYGKAVQYGAEIAVEEINAKGGLQIELRPEDDECVAEKSINAYNNLKDWNVQMICGTVTTDPCISVGAYAYGDRVFMLTPSASALAVIEDKDNVYQVCFTDPAQGTASAQYIAEHELASKIAVIYNSSSLYSIGIYQTFMEKARELNLDVVLETTFDDNTNDFTVQVGAAKEAGAELVFLPIYYTPASLILKTAKDADYAPIFFGVDGMDGILTLENFDTSLAEGVMLLTPFSADAQDELTVNFVKSYKDKTGEIPNQFAADAYDTIYALYNAAVAAGVTPDMPYDQVCDMMIAAMQDLQIDGLTGSMTWDETGAVTKTPTAVIIENGVYVGFAK